MAKTPAVTIAKLRTKTPVRLGVGEFFDSFAVEKTVGGLATPWCQVDSITRDETYRGFRIARKGVANVVIPDGMVESITESG